MTGDRPSSDGLAIVTLGAFDEPAAREVTALDARCARSSLRWPDDRPCCCARGALVDGRARLQVVQRLSLEWSSGPRQHDPAPSGIVERLADVPWTGAPATLTCCSALDVGVPRGGVRGEGCRIRAAASAAGLTDDAWLLSGCALFPLELVEGVLVPSPRIPDDALVPWTPGARSLWDDARARVVSRHGVVVADAIDEGVARLHAHRAQGLHLKTLK